MKPIRSFMVLALLILFPVAAHAAMVGNVTHVTGRVDITSPGETARPANVGDEVNQDDIIRTKSNSKAEVTFLDGNILRLAEETRVEIAEYVMEEEQVTGVLNLFRGKLQNIVSTIGKEFGRDKQNHFEVHTATAVCGVRGTNFFPWFQRGVSGATFQEGEGYVYSKGRPDEERTVHAGQTALVVSADQPPMVRPATDEEMGEHVEDTFPSEAEDDDEGDDEGEGEGEGDGEGGTPEGYEPPEDEGLGEPEGGDDTTPPPPPPPYIPPDVPTEPTTTTYTDFSSPVEFSFLEGEGDFATLSGSINDDTNQGTLSLSGTSLDFPTEGIWGGDVGATLSDGSGLEGGLAGISGTWEGLLTSIYVTGDGGAGYIYGDLSGDFNETNNTFAGSGSATRSPILGYTDITPDGLADALLEDSLFEGYPVPILGSIDVGSAIWPDDSEEFGIRGIETNSGRLLGVWGATTGGEGGTYFNDPGLAAWYGIYGDPSGDYYMLGVVSGIDDSAGQTLVEDQVGHVSINGGLYYLDPYYQGYISIEYRGTYCDVTGYYESVGAGTYTLDPLAYSGYWDWGFAPGFLLCNNEDGSIYLDEEVGLAGIQYGLIGGLIAPWDGPADFLAMGEYDDFESGGTYLWNSFIYDNEIEDGGDGGYFKGFTGGTWKGGIMEGAARAIYVSPPDPENNNLSTAGILTGDLLGNYYEMEEDEWIYGMWIAVGSLTPEEMATYLNPANVNINYAGLLASLAGHFGSDGSIEIYGEQGYWLDCMDWGITLFIYDDSSGTSLPWGIYDLKLGNNNYYVGKSGDEIDWLAVVGGYGGFDDSYEGYWLASVDGTWKATSATTDSNESGEITGGLAGRYLTPFQMGTIQGPFFGLYDQDGVCQESGGYGTWIGESIGTFEGEPLAFSGDWGTESCCTLLNNNYGDINRAGKDYGNFGLASNQDGSYEFLAMGNYVDWGGYGGAYVWSTSLYGDEVTQDGGSGNSDIFGFTGGFWKEDTDEENWPFIMNGAARVITMDSYGNVSLLAGNISGNYYEMGYGFDYYWWEEGDLGMWIAEGSLEPVAGTETVLNPDYEYSIDWGGLQDARLAGYFIGSGPSGNIYGEQYQEQYTSFITYYDGSDYKSLPWGIYNLKLGSNNYYNNPDDISSSWAIVGGEGQFDNSYEGYWLATVKADWENGEIAGNVGEVAGEPDTFGRYLTPYQMGHIQGPLFGLYDGPDEDGDGTWIGESIGTFEGEPLAFSSSFDGDTYRLVEGRSYAGDFERSDGYGGYDAYYNYEYFISDESGDLLFGENWEDCYVSGNESGDVYLPDGTYVGISDGPLPMSFTRGSWSVGTMSDSDFSDPPEGTWDRHWYEEWDSNCLTASGDISGIMGGTGDLWSATATESANITLMGMYQPTDGNYDQPSLFGVEIQSSDITTGAYSGYLGGVINEVVGAVYAVYIDPSQNAGILKGDFSGPTYPEIGMWEADGSIYRIVMESEDIGISPNELDVNLDEGIMVGWVSGDFGADDSELYSYLGWGSTLSISGHDDWGIFQLAFGYDNYAENPLSSTTWSARAGGFGEFGTHVGYGGFSKPDTGIWLTSLMTGDLDSPAEGMLTADFSGKYLTYAKYGDFTGEVIGTYDTNSWQAMAAGYWENGRDLKFNGVLDGDDLYTMRKEYHGHWDDGYGGSYYDYAYYEGDNAGWSCEYDASTETETHVSYNPDGTTETWWVDGYGGLYYEEGEYVDTVYDNVRIGPDGVIVEPDEVPSYYLGDNGWIDGFMGGLDDLWAATDINQAETRFIGEYESWWYDGATTPSVFTLGIQSYNPYHDNWTIWNQEDPTNPLSGDGAYYGFMGGRILGDDVAGGIMALYVDNSENAGILKGSFDGDVYPDLEMWDAAGSIYPIEMEPGISTIPEALYSNIDESGINFSGYGYGGGYLGVVVSEGESMSIAGQDWGIWNSMLGGYGGAESDWTLHLHNVVADPDEIHRLAEVEGYQSADGDITADVAGAWVNLTDAITGVMGGELIGTFDAEAFTYQAVAAGSWLETNRFLAMAGAPDGRDALAGLNIPCIEVGRTNLAGDNDDLTVNMNDVTFFSYSTGASPKIWATGDVNGTYNTLTPAPVNNLTGDNVGGFNASFTMNNMTETAPGSNIGNWDASVVGSGTISTHSINIQGAAAGDFGGVAEATTGDFNGTGAGVATPSPTD